jgi:hypothetical protein
VFATACALLALGVAPAAAQQVIFSIDYKGARHGATATGTPFLITEGDLLLPPLGAPSFGATAPPRMFRPTPQLGLTASCSSPGPGFPCDLEVDALSFGTDKPFVLSPDRAAQPRLFFSVDVQAIGKPAGPAPSVFTEAAQNEAAADVYSPYLLFQPPLDIGAIAVPRNTLVLDGNGDGPSASHYRGLGLVEPHLVPVPPPPPSPPYLIGGDDLDALAFAPAVTPNVVYFSLDSAFVDPRTGVPNSGSSAAVPMSVTTPGRVGGAVLQSPAGGPVTVYATATQLGLDLFGIDTDDLDALILVENGVPEYQPSVAPFDWLPGAPGGQKDLLIFSLRRGSALIVNQVLDSNFGRPIAAGDLLVPPMGTGLASFPPGIFIAAENLGLRTNRTDGAPEDDLDAAASGEVRYDCNNNEIEDAVDIATGSSADANKNGIPDECEPRPFCLGDGTLTDHTTPCPCANSGAAGNGCGHSFNAAGANMTGTGDTNPDTFQLQSSGMPASSLGLYMQHDTIDDKVFHDGTICAGGSLIRLRTRAAVGGASAFPDSNYAQDATLTLSTRGMVVPGSGVRRYYAKWYRNVSSTFCPPATANVTNGFIIDW